MRQGSDNLREEKHDPSQYSCGLFIKKIILNLQVL